MIDIANSVPAGLPSSQLLNLQAFVTPRLLIFKSRDLPALSPSGLPAFVPPRPPASQLFRLPAFYPTFLRFLLRMNPYVFFRQH